jgi:hypothetical protein
MPDFRDFLKPKDPIVLPYFGGMRVEAADRRLRVEGTIEPGWWRFAIEGRKAKPLGNAEPLDASQLGALPAMRGHWIDGWIVTSGREISRVALAPAEEPAPLSRVVGRRWYSGDVLLDSIEFEDDAELSARSALEERRGIADARGIVPSLRAAFGYGVGMATARELSISMTHRELSAHIVAIADGGAEAAKAVIEAIAQRRREAESAARARALMEAVNRDRARIRELTALSARERKGSPAERADVALEAAGARMLSARRSGRELEVVFTYMDVRIIATVDAESLHVYDSGICLAGADEELTLDSLPSVIKEAIEEGTLNITRH